MAILHHATLSPSKLELLTGYLGVGALTKVGAYRFDDPDGEVGIETHLVADPDGNVWHLPLTYRSEPLGGIEEWGVGTMEHSVLGRRWVYNGCADPVYAGRLIATILTGGSQVEEYFDTPQGRQVRPPTATVVGSGEPDSEVPTVTGVHAESFDADTLIDAGVAQIVVRHNLSTPEPESTSATLTGTWDGSDAPTILAYRP